MEDEIKECAMGMYDAYCGAVGGKAFNGDPLPNSAEFFADPKKETQSNAWLAAVTAKQFWRTKLL